MHARRNLGRPWSDGDGHRARSDLPDRRRAAEGTRLRHLRHRRALVLQRRPPHRAPVGARPRDQRRGHRDRPRRRQGHGRARHLDRRRRPLHLDALVRALPHVPRRPRAPVRARRADGLQLPGRLRRAGRDPRDRAQEPLPDPRRPLPRPRDLRRPAVGRDLRPQGHRDRPRRHRRRDRRRPRRRGPRRARPAAGRRPGAPVRAQREPARARRGDPRPGPPRLRRHRDRRHAGRGHARDRRTSAQTS